jgi:hypothetical protein
VSFTGGGSYLRFLALIGLFLAYEMLINGDLLEAVLGGELCYASQDSVQSLLGA